MTDKGQHTILWRDEESSDGEMDDCRFRSGEDGDAGGWGEWFQSVPWKWRGGVTGGPTRER